MAPKSTRPRSLIAAALLLSIAVGACDNSIDPFSGSTRYYAIFGFLDADVDSQFVRIEPTRNNPELGAVSFDVESVTTMDLSTGLVTVWSDSLVELEDGGEGLLYLGIFRPIRGRNYKIEIRRSDGAVTTATTRVPEVPSLSVRTPSRSFLGALEQGLLFDGVQRQPEMIVVNYAVTFGALSDPIEVKLPYNVFGVPEGPGWRIIVRLTRDRSTVLERLSLTSSDRVALHTLSIDVRLLSDDWPTDDLGVEESNVTNGFGYFGSTVTHHAVWILDSLYVNELGFINKQSTAGSGS